MGENLGELDLGGGAEGPGRALPVECPCQGLRQCMYGKAPRIHNNYF